MPKDSDEDQATHGGDDEMGPQEGGCNDLRDDEEKEAEGGEARIPGELKGWFVAEIEDGGGSDDGEDDDEQTIDALVVVREGALFGGGGASYPRKHPVGGGEGSEGPEGVALVKAECVE